LSGKGDMLILCLACVNIPNTCDMAWLSLQRFVWASVTLRMLVYYKIVVSRSR
jgi:hypothetical protein